MKVTKYLHSCLLVEEGGEKILIDPGEYSYAAKILDLNKLDKIDYLLITHEHADHMYIPFIKEILEKFPAVKIITNSQVAVLLSKEGINAGIEGNTNIQLNEIIHERVWDNEPPQDTVFTLYNRLTHPGDSLHFDSKAEIIALPIQAPWCSTYEAVNKALELNPKVILPIHDWHWKDEVRSAMYERLEKFFAGKGILFKKLLDGESVDL